MVQRSARLDLEPLPTSVSRARRFVRSVLVESKLEQLIDVVVLLTSEVATNAVLHARTPFAVAVAVGSHEVLVDVLDGSPVPPRRQVRGPSAATGRGVALVDRLSDRWGPTPESDLRGFIKGVRFAIALDGPFERDWTEQER